MYKLWCLIIYGFVPRWIIIKEGLITHPNGNGAGIGRYYIVQCEQTGRVKSINFKV